MLNFYSQKWKNKSDNSYNVGLRALKLEFQSFSSRDNSISGSANSSLRRKLFESVSDSDSEPEGDFQPVHFTSHSPRYDTHHSPSSSKIQTGYEPVTPGSEQFSSSPIKVSPGACSTATSPGALSCVGGDLQSPYQNNSPYRSPFRWVSRCLSQGCLKDHIFSQNALKTV